MTFTIGGIPVLGRVLCAPMCGASKLPYRRMATRFGADVVYTEMIKAGALVRGCRKTRALLATTPDERNVAPQICGADPSELAGAAALLEQLGFPLVDLNMGCPVRKIVSSGAGAALLKDPAKVEALTRACVRAVGVPVTVKIRSGWDDRGHVDAAIVARAAEAGGAALVTVHGRARSEKHTGEIDYDALARAKRAVSIPVVGNGGIRGGDDALTMIRQTGCDAVMIGRGAYGRPWVFRDVARALAGLPPLPDPTLAEVAGLALEHLDGMVDLMGSHGVLVFRKYAAWYFKGAPHSAQFRDRAHRLREPEAMRELIVAWRVHLRLCEGKTPAQVPPPFPGEGLRAAS